ncbi:hypothetical protein ACHAXS_008505 [Conticribra weissflogii]
MTKLKRPTSLLRSFTGKGSITLSTTTDNPAFTGDGVLFSAADAAKLVTDDFLSGGFDAKTSDGASSYANFSRDSSSDISRSSENNESDDAVDDAAIEDLHDYKSNLNSSFAGPSPLADVLDRLGPNPTHEELSLVAGQRAKAQLDRCLASSTSSCSQPSIICHERFRALPGYSKSDLIIGGHLGKGSFSDVFEVTLVVRNDQPRASKAASKETLEEDAQDLDAIFAKLESKFAGVPVVSGRNASTIGIGSYASLPTSTNDAGTEPGGVPTAHVATAASSARRKALYARRSSLRSSVCMGSLGTSNHTSAPPCSNPSDNNSTAPTADNFQTQMIPRRHSERTHLLAMKCLRPQIRSNPEQFLIGVDDLIHETAILSSLDHPHIIALHGRRRSSSGTMKTGNDLDEEEDDLTQAFRKVDDGYFILLDRLTDTLDVRMERWKAIGTRAGSTVGGGRLTKNPPSLPQLKTAYSIADALSYLHSKQIVFRDLKPSNVGYDSSGVLKLFDFGFATGYHPEREEAEDGLLYDKCGTPRYMAPEVGLMKGYGFEADVYSFGILLWEICALKKPFGKIKSAKEFDKIVFVKGERPKVRKGWSIGLAEIMTQCWDRDRKERPNMSAVKSQMAALVMEARNRDGEADGESRLRKSKMFKRLTWDL